MINTLEEIIMTVFKLEIGNENKDEHNNDINEYNRILVKNKELIDTTLPKNPPKVSIIMLNRNGAMFLRSFFKHFKKNTIYKNYEIIVVENASTDKSISILEKESKLLPLTIIKNKENKNFSKGCNQGAKYAKGEYILLINNDTEPTYGWLNEMIKCALRTSNVGSVCPKILYPSTNEKMGLLVQQCGMYFMKKGNLYHSYILGQGYKPFDSRVNKEGERIIASAAVLLVKKDIYFEVGGFDENYDYGHEDVDFTLKINKRGYVNMYCPTGVVFHHMGETRFKKVPSVVILERREKNIKLFNKKWGKWIKEKWGKKRVIVK